MIENNQKEHGQDSSVPLENLMHDDPELRGRIGQHLGGLRKQRGISQDDAARGVGMSRPHLSNVETGRSKTSWPGLEAMAAFYTEDIAELLEKCRAPGWEAPGEEMTQGSFDKATTVRAKQGADSDNGIGPYKAYTAHNLTSFEKFVMTGFHLLSGRERREVMEDILARLRSHLDKPT